MANKALKNEGTKDIVNKLMGKGPSLDAQRKTVVDNYMRMGIPQQSNLLITEAKHNENILKMSQSEYTTASPKKWLSDKEFADKFDKFIVTKREEDTGTAPKETATVVPTEAMTKE